MKHILIAILILGFVALQCSAVDINIYYPNDNMTTDIHYAESGNYSHVTANNVSGDFTAVILQSEMEYNDIIGSPHYIIKPMFGIIMIIVLISFFIVIAKGFKKIWR